MKVKHLIQELQKIKDKERDIQILIGDDDKDHHGSDDFTLMHTLDNDMVIQKVMRQLPAGDINKIMSTVMCEGYGLTTEIRVLCSHCGHDSVMELPLNKNFFSAS